MNAVCVIPSLYSNPSVSSRSVCISCGNWFCFLKSSRQALLSDWRVWAVRIQRNEVSHPAVSLFPAHLVPSFPAPACFRTESCSMLPMGLLCWVVNRGPLFCSFIGSFRPSRAHVSRVTACLRATLCSFVHNKSVLCFVPLSPPAPWAVVTLTCLVFTYVVDSR